MKQIFSNIWKDFLNSYKSVTIWVNGAAITILSFAPLMQETFPQMKEYLTADAYKAAMGAIILLNIVLRFKTSKPLRGKGEPE